MEALNTLLAQPQHPASERALKEILLGEGESSLLSDKNAFSEFMYKVTESVLLGHADPPTAASVLSSGGDFHNQRVAAREEPVQDESRGHQPVQSNTVEDWSASRHPILTPHGNQTATMRCPVTDTAPTSRGLAAASKKGKFKRTSSGVEHKRHDTNQLTTPDSTTVEERRWGKSASSPSLLEELRRWRSQAEENIGTPIAIPHLQQSAPAKPSSSSPGRPPARPVEQDINNVSQAIPAPDRSSPTHLSDEGAATTTAQTSLRGCNGMTTANRSEHDAWGRSGPVESDTRYPAARERCIEQSPSLRDRSDCGSTESFAAKAASGIGKAVGSEVDITTQRSPHGSAMVMCHSFDHSREGQLGLQPEYEGVDDCEVDMSGGVRKRSDRERSGPFEVVAEGRKWEKEDEDPFEMSLDLSDCSREVRWMDC